jgi:hypothetical protein|tara:strand:+ start:871 stop:1059 length:189 start_codon:yes stop_codon:yes gene_type:complete
MLNKMYDLNKEHNNMVSYSMKNKKKNPMQTYPNTLDVGSSSQRRTKGMNGITELGYGKYYGI